MGSKHKTPLDDQRIAFCESHIIGGLRTSEIIDRAQDNPYFVNILSLRSSWETSRIVSRKTIRGYVAAARAKLRIQRLSSNPNTLAQQAYDRLFEAFCMAKESGNVRDMILAQKEINRMLGLRKETIIIEVDPDKIREQFKGMVEATTPKEGGDA